MNSHKVEEGLQKLMSQVEEVSVMLSTSEPIWPSLDFGLLILLVLISLCLMYVLTYFVELLTSQVLPGLDLIYSQHEMNEALVQWPTMFSRTLSRLRYSVSLYIGSFSCKVLIRSQLYMIYVEEIINAVNTDNVVARCIS